MFEDLEEMNNREMAKLSVSDEKSDINNQITVMENTLDLSNLYYLESQNEKLSKLVLDLEERRVAIVEENNSIRSSLSGSTAFLWSWDVNEKLINVQLPSPDNEDSVEDGMYTFDKFIDKIHPQDIHKLQFDDTKRLKVADQNFTVDLRVNFNGLDYIWFEFRGKVLYRDPNGNALFLKGVYFDIAKRKKEELLQTKRIEALQEADRVRSTLFSNFTQEIRTPLHALIGFADILADIEDRFERQKYLNIIKNNNDILLNLIENICEYSEAETPEEELKKDVICLWEHLVEMHQVFSMKIDKDVKLVFTNTYDGRKIVTDKGLLSEIVSVLLHNSIVSTNSGKITYGFELTRDKLIITVADTSSGIQSGKTDNIFSSYEKMDSLSNNTGFNMSLCKSLVNKMNGEIFINAEFNVGTTYTVELPLILDAASKSLQNTNPVTDRKLDLSAPIGSGLPVILVAEDVHYGFLMLKTLLQDRYEVIHAEDGARAVELFQQRNPVFVFMDIKMPVMDGIEATRRIREISKNVPIVVLTAYAVRSLRKEATEAGCTDMLTKPTSSKQINATIRKYLR
ncbi:MAG: response regulator [Bacteroidales bacterium]